MCELTKKYNHTNMQLINHPMYSHWTL